MVGDSPYSDVVAELAPIGVQLWHLRALQLLASLHDTRLGGDQIALRIVAPLFGIFQRLH